MHYYACPYCKPCTKARLIKAKDLQKNCKHKKPLFNKDKKCKENKFKCKEIMKCQKCKETFVITKKFLRDAKRKIKDG